MFPVLVIANRAALICRIALGIVQPNMGASGLLTRQGAGEDRPGKKQHRTDAIAHIGRYIGIVHQLIADGNKIVRVANAFCQLFFCTGDAKAIIHQLGDLMTDVNSGKPALGCKALRQDLFLLGDVTANKISIQEGAIFNGYCKVGVPTGATLAAAPAPVKKGKGAAKTPSDNLLD